MLFKFYNIIILIPTVYIHKKTDFLEIIFAFSLTPCETPCRCDRPDPDMLFLIFLTCVSIKYNIRLLQA